MAHRHLEIKKQAAWQSASESGVISAALAAGLNSGAQHMATHRRIAVKYHGSNGGVISSGNENLGGGSEVAWRKHQHRTA